ncbi:hypothetical protein [Acidiferrobacter sp.]|uniref:hypothetical protein n=1 Tax=Acidiferrobacter sp. TaxID=1872107 RepID=UPI0026190210|nr:hypothetical protein [Acidiferrobacter sp.]
MQTTGYFGEDGKPSIPDLAFGSTQEKRGETGGIAARMALRFVDRLTAEPEQPLLTLATHRKAVKSWMEASDAWKQRALEAEKELLEARAIGNENYDYSTAWREAAAIYAFGGPPYPAKGVPERDAFSATFEKIKARKTAARAAGRPENKSPLP